MKALLSRTLAAVALAAGAAAAHAAPPDLDMVVRYETRQVLASGVSRTETWKERVVRRGDSVWTERVLPASARAAHAHETGAEHVGHKHFDFERAARWVQRDAQGRLALKFADRAHRVVVSVPQAEYGAVGFDGRWDAVAHIVPPQAIAAMPPAVPASSREGQWHSEKAGGWSHRVLWSDAKQVALRVESRRDDGSFQRRVMVEPASAAAALPWAGIEGYTQKEYDDFMD